jgi:hypothetical protein
MDMAAMDCLGREDSDGIIDPKAAKASSGEPIFSKENPKMRVL